MTFVAVDGKGGRVAIPAVIPETDEQKRRYEEAGRRRDTRHTYIERRRNRKG
jgi:acyl-CoA hydrolase